MNDRDLYPQAFSRTAESNPSDSDGLRVPLLTKRVAPKEFIPKHMLANPVKVQSEAKSPSPGRAQSHMDRAPEGSLRDIPPDKLRIPARTPVRITMPEAPLNDGCKSHSNSPQHAATHLPKAEHPPRSNSTRRPTSPAIQKHANYYFPDGSVILQLKGIQFRVHPHLLGRQSVCLAKLFAEEQPVHAQLVDGCKLFLLPGDPRDFESLLGVLYDGFSHISKSQPFSFEFTAQILRASTKHSFPSLRLWAIRELQHAYPPDLDAFDPDNTAFCEERVALARECGINWLARTGLYHAAALKELGIRGKNKDGAWDSDDDDDELGEVCATQEQSERTETRETLIESFNTSSSSITSISSLASTYTYPLRNKDPTPRLSTTLPLSDLQLVIRLLEKFQKRWIHIARAPTPLCPKNPHTAHSGASQIGAPHPTLPSCTHIFAAVWSTHVLPTKQCSNAELGGPVAPEPSATIFAAGFYNPLKGFQTLSLIEWEKLGVCTACAGAVRDEWAGDRKGIWMSMDRWLELDTDENASTSTNRVIKSCAP